METENKKVYHVYSLKPQQQVALRRVLINSIIYKMSAFAGKLASREIEVNKDVAQVKVWDAIKDYDMLSAAFTYEVTKDSKNEFYYQVPKVINYIKNAIDVYIYSNGKYLDDDEKSEVDREIDDIKALIETSLTHEFDFDTIKEELKRQKK